MLLDEWHGSNTAQLDQNKVSLQHYSFSRHARDMLFYRFCVRRAVMLRWDGSPHVTENQINTHGNVFPLRP